MKRSSLLLILPLLLSAAPAEPLRGVCTRVVDGDTIVVEVGGELRIVRVWGVDCPELHHPKRGVEWYGAEAAAFTARFALGRKVRLVQVDTDEYGRLVCQVRVGGRSLSRALLRGGYAFAYSWRASSTDHNHVELMTEARTRGKGLWRRMAFASDVAGVGSD